MRFARQYRFGDRETCLAVDDFLGKPYSVRELRPKLTQWLP